MPQLGTGNRARVTPAFPAGPCLGSRPPVAQLWRTAVDGSAAGNGCERWSLQRVMSPPSVTSPRGVCVTRAAWPKG